jgi:cysteine desulfurase/selenocysteine lyase
MAAVHNHEQFIVGYALEVLSDVPELRLLGPSAAQRGGVATFVMDGLHPHDIAQLLDEEGIAIRAGHHCAMPLHQKLGLAASARASFYVYSTSEEVDALVRGVQRVRRVFRR